MINTKLQSIIDTKSAIGNAITNKGGTITTNTPFFNYAAQIDSISTGGGAYSTFVAQAQDNSKYTVYTGYDEITNPTPNLSNNFAFNRWLLNNSATGDVVLSNVVVAVGGNFNGPNIVANEANMPFVNITTTFGGRIEVLTTNNGFLYMGGDLTNDTVHQFYESNLTLSAQTNYVSDVILSITINNGFIYAGGGFGIGANVVKKFNESTLSFVGNTANYGGFVRTITTNNGFFYVGGQTNRTVQKFGESNLTRVGNTAAYGGDIISIATNNGFIYAGGESNQRVQKFFESNLARATGTNVSNVYGGDIYSIATNNGFIYAGGHTNRTVQKFYEDNLAFVGNTPSYGADIYSLKIKDGFIYVGGSTLGGVNRGVSKFNESTLALVGNTVNYGQILALTVNNGSIYMGGPAQTIKKHQTSGEGQEQFTFYNITEIKE
jgi:hypothetical protein